MDPKTRAFFQDEQRKPENNRCIDCATPNPQWASVSYGTYFCLSCSGKYKDTVTQKTQGRYNMIMI